MSLKLFKNGSLHMSGARTLDRLHEVVHSFADQIVAIVPGVTAMRVREIRVVMLNTHIRTGKKLNIPALYEGFQA